MDELDEYIRASDVPPPGMAFGQPQFRASLVEWLTEFKPDVFAFDPWNSLAQDDKQRDYLEAFQAVRDVLPKGEEAPHWIIAAHTRKPKSDEKKSGRGLLNFLAGSHAHC